MTQTAEIPDGLCECGCGEPAPVAERNRYAIGHLAGKPIRFIDGHQLRAVHRKARERLQAELAASPPSDGLCGCGCGQPAPIATATNRRRGTIAGQPQKFIRGHATTSKPRKACDVEGCAKLTTSALCSMHATRMRRHGNLEGKRPHGNAIDRFWRQVQKTDGCWLWTGSVASTGYGVHWRQDKKLVGAHRFSYELLVGPVPAGFHVDHLCRVRNCVNPQHLQPVTPAENSRRAHLSPEEHRAVSR